jgi:hypothetical protein
MNWGLKIETSQNRSKVTSQARKGWFKPLNIPTRATMGNLGHEIGAETI